MTCCPDASLDWSTHPWVGKPSLSLLFISRQVASEAAIFLYSTSGFHTSRVLDLERFISVVRDSHLSLLTDLRLVFKVDGSYYSSCDLRLLIKNEVVVKMKGLRKLSIKISPLEGTSRHTSCKKFQKTKALPRLSEGIISLHVHRGSGFVAHQNAEALQSVEDVYSIIVGERARFR